MRLWPLLVLAALAAGCASAGGRAGSSFDLSPPSALGPDFLLHQSLEVERGGQRTRFEAALQHRGETLTLLGLTPLGTRAFLIEQQGLEVTFTSFLPEDRELPFPPRLILLDVQRVLLPLLGEGPLSDGVHRGERGGEIVEETWRGGRLLARRFRSREGEISISYEGGMAPGEAPARVVLENGRLGYRLEITTLSSQRL